LVAAHRADWRNAPENSLNGIKRAIGMGVDIVEIDIRKTKDGKLIVMHDFTLDRTSTGKGLISETVYDSIAKLFLRDGANAKTKNKIPTLKEVMLLVKNKPVLVNLDKAWDYIPETYQVLIETGTVEQGLFKGYDPIELLKSKYPDIMTKINYMPMVHPMKIEKEPLQFTKNFIKESRPVAFEVTEGPPLFELIWIVQKAKVAVWINTLWDNICAGHSDDMALENPDANWGEMIKWGANVIQTDRPKELLDYLNSKKLH
jgi:glycerophosphoryl diester phosphodiesterase